MGTRRVRENFLHDNGTPRACTAEMVREVGCITRRTDARSGGWQTAAMTSTERPRVVAVVLAGGIGARVGGEVPKQLLEVAGRPLMTHALAAFDAHPAVDRIVLVMHPDHLDTGLMLADALATPAFVVPGGATRSDSTLAALATVEDDDLLLVHDAARPFVPAAMVDRCLAALVGHDAVSTVIDSADTIWQVDAEGRLAAIPARDSLRRVQTPQGFRARALRAAYDAALRDPAFEATDDAAVVFRYTPEVAVALVEGDVRNVKVTTASDLDVVAGYLS